MSTHPTEAAPPGPERQPKAAGGQLSLVNRRASPQPDRVGAFEPARPTVRRMAEVEPERVEWLWPGRLPIGKLVVLDGDPGCGKSTLTLDLTAHFSAGTILPDGFQPEQGCNVVLLSAEDGPGDTIRPRLDAAGADPTRIVLIEDIVEADPESPEGVRRRMPRIPDDIAHLGDVVRAEQAKLVVIDVLAAFLTGRVDAHRDQDIRGALAPLARMAEATRCCVVAIRHLNKSGGGKALLPGWRFHRDHRRRPGRPDRGHRPRRRGPAHPRGDQIEPGSAMWLARVPGRRRTGTWLWPDPLGRRHCPQRG